MPRTVRYRGLLLIEGPGLDDVLEPSYSLVLLDEFYADLYGDYVFLGYNVYAAPYRVDRADLVGLYTAATLASEEPAIIVCGRSPGPCLYALAARLVLEGARPGEALLEASKTLRGLYEDPGAARTGQADTALLGLYHSLRAAGGAKRLGLVMGLASSYDYGGLYGSLHYGEAVAWTAVLEPGPGVLLAALLHFLAEGPGDEWTILRRRLEAVGEANLEAALGPGVEEALRILRSYARKQFAGGAAVLAAVEALEPGGDTVIHFEKRQGERTAVAYCQPDTSGGPSKKCVEAVGKASRLLEETGLVERVRVSLDSPGPLGELP